MMGANVPYIDETVQPRSKNLIRQPEQTGNLFLDLPGFRLSYRRDNAPKEVISKIIKEGGNGLEYFALKDSINSSSLQLNWVYDKIPFLFYR
jgi:hypothetical protein